MRRHGMAHHAAWAMPAVLRADSLKFLCRKTVSHSPLEKHHTRESWKQH